MAIDTSLQIVFKIAGESVMLLSAVCFIEKIKKTLDKFQKV